MTLSIRLFRMTWPMLIGMLAISSTQLADSAFIGQLGSQPLAILGFTLPVYQLIIGFQVGLGIATTAMISKALGSAQRQSALQLGALVLACGLVIITLLCVFLWQQQRVILNLLGAETGLLADASAFWFPWLISCWLGAMLYFGFSIFRAHGKTRLPGMVLLLSSLINLILDPVFIFAFDLGLPGAAWATCCAFGCGCLIIFYQLLRDALLAAPDSVSQARLETQRLMRFTAPATLSQFLPPLSAMITTAMVSVFGTNLVAAWGIGSRIEFFSIIIVLSLTMSLPQMIGRLLGSQQWLKIEQLVAIAIRFILLSQLAITLITLLLSQSLSSVMTTDAAVAGLVTRYLWLVPLSYGALGVSMVMVSVCSALGMPGRALAISAIRLLFCYLPLVWLGGELGGYVGLFAGASLGNIVAGILSWMMYRHLIRQLQQA